jgi:hypothetical protein
MHAQATELAPLPPPALSENLEAEPESLLPAMAFDGPRAYAHALAPQLPQTALQLPRLTPAVYPAPLTPSHLGGMPAHTYPNGTAWCSAPVAPPSAIAPIPRNRGLLIIEEERIIARLGPFAGSLCNKLAPITPQYYGVGYCRFMQKRYSADFTIANGLTLPGRGKVHFFGPNQTKGVPWERIFQYAMELGSFYWGKSYYNFFTHWRLVLRRYNQVFYPAPDAPPLLVLQDVRTTLKLVVNGELAPRWGAPHYFTAGVHEAVYMMRYATLLEWLGVC